jgi:hypothetical protein
MSSAKYQALPSDEYDEEGSIHHRHIPEHHQLSQDLRFNPPTPPWWKRALIILFILAMFWLYFSLRASMQRAAESEIVHVQRYVCISCCFFCLRILIGFRWYGALTFFFYYFPKILKATQVPPRGESSHL